MTIKNLTDLPGLTETNVEELAAVGIHTPAELAYVISDDEGLKEVIKACSGVGPKTASAWKDALAGVEDESEEEYDEDESEEEEEESEEEYDEDESVEIEEESAALVEAGESAVVEIEEEGEESEVVEARGYTPKAKPVLDDETVDALAKRAVISGRRPAFKRQEWFRYSKLGDEWRRPKGIHSKMKRGLKRRPPMVEIGYRGPVKARGLHPSGFEEVLVYNVSGLEQLDPTRQAIRIGGTVGTKKRIQIEDRADELGLRVLNRLVRSWRTSATRGGWRPPS